jgi:hypothetical protein
MPIGGIKDPLTWFFVNQAGPLPLPVNKALNCCLAQFCSHNWLFQLAIWSCSGPIEKAIGKTWLAMTLFTHGENGNSKTNG